MGAAEFIFIGMICTTPINTPDGEHECYTMLYPTVLTAEACDDYGVHLRDSLADHNIRVVKGICRTPMPQDFMKKSEKN